MSKSSQSTHVIFDCAGTLVDVFPAAVQFLTGVAQEYGFELLPEHLAQLKETDAVSGELEKFTAKLCLSKGLDPSDHKEELKRLMTERFFKNDFPMVSGVQKLVRHLRQSGVPMAIATNMKGDEFRSGMGRVVGFDFNDFSHYVCGGDHPEVENNKPAPDVYLVCAKRFRPAPISLDRCVVFEDSIRGITGAISSGMKTVLISDKRSSQLDAIRDQITAVVNSFDEFRPESVGLPSYPDPDQLKKLA